MNKLYKSSIALAFFALLSWSVQGQMQNTKQDGYAQSVESAKLTLKKTDGKIWFEENKGQFPAQVLYGFKTRFGAMYVEKDHITMLAIQDHEPDEDPASRIPGDSSYRRIQTVKIEFGLGSNPLKPQPKELLPAKINYFQSPTPAGFVTDVNTYGELYIPNVYAGIDLRLYSQENGQIEFDWILQKAADFTKIKMIMEGHEGLNLTDNGGFEINCHFTKLRFNIPESYQMVNGAKQLVNFKYGKADDNTVVFTTQDKYLPNEVLVIDPTVMWANFFTQTGGDYLFASESDNCGRVYAAGRSKGSLTAAYVQGATGGYGYTTASVNFAGILYIFSADGDSIKAVAYYGVDVTPADIDLFPNGKVLLAGSRRDKNGNAGGTITAVNAYSTNTSLYGFVAVMGKELNTLDYSSHAPGTQGTFNDGYQDVNEYGVTCVEIEDNNTYYIAGITDVAVPVSSGTASLRFVDGTAADATFAETEGYICRFSGTNYNTREWGTYVGGNKTETMMSIKISSDSTKLAFGGTCRNSTISSNLIAGFPTLVNPVDNVATTEEGFVGVIPSTSSIPTSFSMLSYIGGSGEEGDLLVETMNNYIYTMQYTNSTNLPGVISGTSFRSSLQGDYDVAISRIPINGSAGSGFRSTYFGGDETELSGGIIFNTNDSNLYLFVTTGSESTTLQGGGASGATNPYPALNTTPPSNFYDGRHGSNGGTWRPQDNNGIGSKADISFVTISPDLTTNIFTSFCGGDERDYLGNTGRLNGAGHYGFNRISNIYSLGTTIHSGGADLAPQGTYIFNPISFFDTSASSGGDDHFIVKFNLSNTDMGDAPASYDGSDPARHGTNSLGLQVAKFGSATTDYDSRPESSQLADGDDNRNTGPVLCAALLDDEDGLVSKDVLSVETNGTWNLTYRASNSTGSTANIYMWVDLDGNGLFEADEIASSVPTLANKTYLGAVTFSASGTTITATKTAHGLTSGSYVGFAGIEGNGAALNGQWQITSVTANTFTFSVNTAPGSLTGYSEVAQPMTETTLSWSTSGKSCPSAIVGGRTYIRMRITTSSLTDNAGTTNVDERSRGISNNGEIEDHVMYIRGRDYSDLPAPYPTASAMVYEDNDTNNIPETAGAVWLGSIVDIEKDCAAHTNAAATGDDNYRYDDEDGLVIPSGPKKPSTNYTFPLTFGRATAGSTVFYGMWIDWNADGDFTDATDGFYNGSTTAGSVNVSVTSPASSAFSPYFAVRVMARTTSFASTNYNASFTNGEVEDYINDPGLVISGTVFDDGDGTYDGAIDGTPGGLLNRPSGTQLWAYLSTSGSVIVDTLAVKSDGTYFLQGATASTAGYRVRISTNRVAIGGSVPAVAIPTNWVSTGEQYGTNNNAGSGIEALTPASNSIVIVSTGTSNVTNVNFGLDFRPTSDPKTAAAQPNPAGTTQYQVPTLTGNDSEQGSFTTGTGKTFVLSTLPANANVYYNGTLITSAGQVISNYVASQFTVDPTFTGVGTVRFTYAWRDSAQQLDQSPDTVTMPFTDPSITISGTVFDDGDGTFDSQVDGTPFNKPSSTQLYAYLVDNSNVVIDSQYVLTNGTYSLTSPSSTSNLKVIITTTQLAIGATAGSNNIPSNWLFVGETYGSNNTAGSGIEGNTTTANGTVALNAGTSNITGLNFGLNFRPTSDDKTASTVVNPGGTTKVTAPTLTGGDLEDGTGGGLTLPGITNTIVITTLPTNGTLYYNNVAVNVNQVIANYSPSLLSVDPTFNGAGTVTFQYVWRDSAHALDASPATVTMPFSDLTLSGSLFDDGDGNYDGSIDGTGIGSPDATQLYAYLDSAGIAVRKVTLPSNGAYSFANLASTTSYTVVISGTSVALGAATPSTAALPSTWVTTGEQFGTNNTAGTGLEDATAPFVSNGRVAITTGSGNLSNVNFGIDKQPNSDNVTASSQVNPGGNVQVTVPTLTGTDEEDGTGGGKTLPGITNNIIIETLPSNATLYYNNVAVSAGQVIANYNPSLLTVDPTFNGAGTVTFTYAWRDSAREKDQTPATVSMPFSDLTLSGTLFDDGDGNYDGAIDGTGIGSPDATQLYAYLDSAGIAVRKVTLPSNGTFSFANIASTTSYTVVISGTSVAVGAATPSTTALPSTWVTTGEQFGTNNSAGTGLEDATAPFTSNGRIAITTGSSNLANVNFGIDKQPNSDNVTASSQVNPGGTNTVTVPTLTGTDNEDGTGVSKTLPGITNNIVISTLPTNATLYYNGVAVTAGQVIANYNPSLLTVDPTFNGAGTVTFTYAWRDSAQELDQTPATVSMPFSDLTLSGTLFDDGDGNYDGAIDGTGIGSPDATQLYAYLDSAGIAVRKVTLPSNGTYSFANIASTTSYTVVISGTSVAVGAATPSTTALPSTWVTTGEQFGTNNSAGTGLEDATAPFVSNGRIAITTGSSNLANVNFGIDKQPNSDNVTASSQVNPGGTNTVTVPTLTGTDNEDGNGVGKTLPGITNNIVISTLPTNATLYYNGVAVTAGQVIANYNPSLLTVDPTFNGAGTVTFTYAWRDSAQELDQTPATVNVPFSDLSISGTVFDDGDGNLDGAIDGTGIGSLDGTQLYAYLDSAGIAVRKVTLPSSGVYSFSNLASTTNYTVLISSTSVSVGAASPSPSGTPATNWLSTGEQYGTNNTAGTGIETGTANSSIAITTGTSNLSNVNFGLNKRPTSDDKTVTGITNPGGTTQVQTPTLTGGDLEDGAGVGQTLPGITNTIVITTLPTTGTLYYNNIAVSVNQVIPNYNPSLLTVDPAFNGAGTITFNYVWRDSAHALDLSPALVTMEFGDLTISGTVFDDGDGNLDGAIDGTGIGSLDGTQLYAYLDSAGLVVRKITLPASGNYSFANISSTTTYGVIISSNNVSIGAASPAASANPATNWVSTGEQYGSNNTAGSGIESGTANSAIVITTASSNISNVNFGIDKRPTTDKVTAASQLNPGGTVQVQVPSLTGTDLEDGVGVGQTLPNNSLPSNTFVVSTLPANATLYYNNAAVSAGQVIANYNPALLTVDPSFTGAGTVVFTYAWRDSAHLADLSPDSVIMPFTGLNISGTLYHDANGIVDANVNGTPIGNPASTQAYAYLIKSGLIQDKSTINISNGTFSFATGDANTAYSVRISTANLSIGAAAPGSTTLPTNWINVGEDQGSNNAAGNGLTAGTPDGVMNVTTSTTDVTGLEFGIEVSTTAHDKTYLVNPDSITGITGLGWGNFTHFINLNAANGTVNAVINSNNTAVKPGKVSGLDPEDGNYDGATGAVAGKTAFTSLPSMNDAVLVYNNGTTDILLVPNPTITDPSYTYWNTTTNRYEIPNLVAGNLKLYLKMNFQSANSFQYAYMDAAGIFGSLATYTLSFTVPLPVSISDLNCARVNNAVSLSWTGYDLAEADHFEVLRAGTNAQFDKIASIAISDADRNVPKVDYSYTDRTPAEGRSYYRVVLVTKDGSRLQTNVCDQNLVLQQAGVTVSLAPNPGTVQTNVTVAAFEPQALRIEVLDMLGKTAQTLQVDMAGKISLIPLNTESLAPGVYNIRISYSTGSQVVRFVKE